jgi:D-inositol-3-phosphate glycosyltransferase
MRRLALVVPSLHQGGGVRAVARFLHDAAMASGRWEVKPISLCMASDDPESVSLLRPWTAFRGVRVGQREWREQLVPHVGAVFGELEFQRYRPRAALRRLVEDCDLIQVVCGSPAWANAVVGMGKPVSLQVATLARVERRRRDQQIRSLKTAWRRVMTRMTARLDERALRRVDAIQLENPWMLEHARAANRHRVGVDVSFAPPGVDSRYFAPADAGHGSRSGVLCVGRLDDPRKNPELLLAAYCRLPEALRSKHPLVLAGLASPGPRFWEAAARHGANVRFVHRPNRAELRDLYQRCSVFVLPSDEEGLGIVVLEAMACAVPVVCTRCGGPEGIVTDGDDGFLVDRDEEAAMADRIRFLLSDPRLNAAMGARARRTIEERYTSGVAGDRFLAVWERLAGTVQAPESSAR